MEPSGFKPIENNNFEVEKKTLISRSKSEIGTIRLQSSIEVSWLKDLNGRGKENPGSVQPYKTKVKHTRIEADSKDNSNRKSKSEDNILIGNSSTSIDSKQDSVLEQETKSPLTDVNLRADSVQRKVLQPKQSDEISEEKIEILGSSDSQTRTPLIKRSRSQQLQNSRLSSQFEKEIRSAVKGVKESPFIELDTVIVQEIKDNLSKVKKDSSSNSEVQILSPLEKIFSLVSSSSVLLRGLKGRLDLAKQAAVNNGTQWKESWPYLFLIALDKLIANASSPDEFKRALDEIKDGRMRKLLFDIMGGEARDCLPDWKIFVEQRFLAIESKNQEALALREEIKTRSKELIKNNLNVALVIDPHFPYTLKSLREVVDSYLVSVKDWESKGQAKEAVSPVSKELIERLRTNADLLSRCVERLARVKSLLHDRVTVYKIGESWSCSLLIHLNQLIQLKAAPDEFIQFVTNIKDEEIKALIVDIIGGKKVWAWLQSWRKGVEQQVQEFFQHDVGKLFRNEIRELTKKELRQELALEHLDRWIYQLIEKNLSADSQWLGKDLVQLQESCANQIIEEMATSNKPLILQGFIDKLHETRQIIVNYLTAHKNISHRWSKECLDELSNLIDLSNKLTSKDLNQFTHAISKIKRKSIRILIEETLGKENLSKLTKWHLTVLEKVHQSFKAFALKQDIIKSYAIEWQEKEEYIQGLDAWEILRGYCPDGKVRLFSHFSIQSLKTNFSSEIPSHFTSQHEAILKLLQALKDCGWQFSDNHLTLDAMAQKIVDKEQVSISHFLKGGLAIAAARRCHMGENGKFYHPRFREGPYKMLKLENSCSILIESNQYGKIDKTYHDVICIDHKDLLLPKDAAKVSKESQPDKIILTQKEINQLKPDGNGSYQACSVTWNFEFAYENRENSNNSSAIWTGTMKIKELQFFEEVPFRVQLDILNEYHSRVKTQDKSVIPEPNYKKFEKRR